MSSFHRFPGRIACLISLLATVSVSSAQPVATTYKFSFGSGNPAAGFTQILPDAAYSREKGYGYDFGTKPSGATPYYFSIALPEGTYKVTVTLGDAASDTDTTIKAENRRLMVESARTQPGKFETRSFNVNIRTPKMTPPIPNNAPGRNQVTLGVIESRDGGGLTWDDKLTLEFLGPKPSPAALTIEKVDDAITIFIAGDSTVTDQPGNTTTSWGQMLPRFFKSNVVVANYAESGETMKSFLTALRLDKLLGQMKKGDYFLIQFGHNDSKASWPQTYVEAETTYKLYLKVYIGEARRRGAIPVIISPMERRNGANGNTHGKYPDAVKEVGEKDHVAFINLHDMSKTMYQALGQNVGTAFNDGTHHSRYGAYELAKCVVQGIKDNKLDLASSIVDDFGTFDPARPDPLEKFGVPQSSSVGSRAATQIMGN